MSNQPTTNTNADRLRAEAQQHRRDAADSFERCDTDGFLSQWASGLSALEKDLAAEIADRGGMAYFWGLADLDGNLIPAKLIDTRYGTSWAIFRSADEANAFGSEIVEWVSAFPKREATMTKKGYREVRVLAPATTAISEAKFAGNCRPYAKRLGPAFDPNAQIVEDES